MRISNLCMRKPWEQKQARKKKIKLKKEGKKGKGFASRGLEQITWNEIPRLSVILGFFFPLKGSLFIHHTFIIYKRCDGCSVYPQDKCSFFLLGYIFYPGWTALSFSILIHKYFWRTFYMLHMKCQCILKLFDYF